MLKNIDPVKIDIDADEPAFIEKVEDIPQYSKPKVIEELLKAKRIRTNIKSLFSFP